MFAAVGYGEISAATVANRLTGDLRKKVEDESSGNLKKDYECWPAKFN